MKLKVREYSVKYLSVEVPKEVNTDKNIVQLQSVAVDEFTRLKDGIEVSIEQLYELGENREGEVEDSLLQFISYLLKHHQFVDTFVFIPE